MIIFGSPTEAASDLWVWPDLRGGAPEEQAPIYDEATIVLPPGSSWVYCEPCPNAEECISAVSVLFPLGAAAVELEAQALGPKQN